MSSLAVSYGLDLELELGVWLAGLFSAAELLLQLSVGGAQAKAEATKPSRWSASSSCENLSVEVEERVVVEELDRRARKRYRRLSELYADTIRATSLGAAAAVKKRKRHHDGGGEWKPSLEEATRYGDDH